MRSTSLALVCVHICSVVQEEEDNAFRRATVEH